MSQGQATIDLDQVLERYLSAWNATDPVQRARLLERSVSEDVEFIDPMKQLIGRDALAAHIADVRASFPDVTFAPGGDVDHHNGVFRASWVAMRDGVVVLRGLDVDDVDAGGKLTRILGFFDKK
jgi:SnoaL-like protein